MLTSQPSAITPEQFTTFGDLLKFLRRRAGLTQQELSIGVGYSVSQISRLEKNQRAPDAAAVAARFVPELDLDKEKEWVARLLELAEASHAEIETPEPENLGQKLHHNLPTRLSSFVGREIELAEIAARLKNPDCRLLTLLGTGGIGKTQLALKAASQQLDVFRDGVFFVPLAPLQAGQATLIIPTIASAVGFTFVGARPQQLQLMDYLRPKHMLLLLDNFEHVLEGREFVLEILRNAKQVKVLVTSRAALHVQPEWLLHISGLSYPQTVAPGRDEVLASGAAQLFLERARQVNAQFTLNAETTDAVSRICKSVEGMPLALELAAARTRIFPVGEIAGQVGTSLDTLQSEMHDAHARHRSLRAVLDWSYELLSGPERALFCALSVFAGGWTLDAAEQVGVGANVTGANVTALLKDLVDQSLVVVEPEHARARYRMLEPVRQYAETKLQGQTAYETVHQRHLEFYLALATEAPMYSVEQRSKIATELDNLRAAATWSQHSDTTPQVRLRLAKILGLYFNFSGYVSEARRWLEGALLGAQALHHSLERADATRILADVLAGMNEYALAEAQYVLCMSLYEELGRFQESTWALGRLGNLAREQGDGATARVRLEAALARVREWGDPESIASQLVTLGEVFVLLEQSERAKELIEEGMAISRTVGEDGIINLAWGYNHLAHVAQLEGEFETARRLHEESVPLFRQGGMESGIIYAYHGLAETALGEGDVTLANTNLNKAFVLFQKFGDRMGMAWCLASFAGVAALNEEPERAATLWGAAEALRRRLGARTAAATRATHGRLQSRVREQLGDAAFEAALAQGSALTMQDAIEYALSAQ